MKRIIAGLLVMVMVEISLAPISASAADDVAPKTGRGGFMGFVAGCCFGPRTAMDYNDGKDVHWREWVGLIPIVNIVFAVWNGIDGANGVTEADYAEQYGSTYF